MGFNLLDINWFTQHLIALWNRMKADCKSMPGLLKSRLCFINNFYAWQGGRSNFKSGDWGRVASSYWMWKWGSGAEPLKHLINAPYFARTAFLNISIHSVLDMRGYLLYDFTYKQKWEAAFPPASPGSGVPALFMLKTVYHYFINVPRARSVCIPALILWMSNVSNKGNLHTRIFL